MSGWVELLWHGKRARSFTRESVDENYGPVRQAKRLPLPFQRIELLGIRKETLTPLFPQEEWPQHYPKDWKNLLIWGDNSLAMSSLLQGIEINGKRINLRGKIKLIYIDPPFATGADFSFKVPMPKSWRELIPKNEIVKSPSIMEELAYRDMWGGHTPDERIASYLSYMYDRLVLMKELLANDGSIYVHLDYRMVHYVKLLMDEIFGRENFVNEIIWAYTRARPTGKSFARLHDVILFYGKTEHYLFNKLKVPLSPTTQPPKRIVRDNGTIWERTSFEKDMEDWWHITFHHRSPERLHFPTQKPEKVLERIILASSNEGDIVADFFSGSGTLAAVAEKLGRRWVCCDMSKYAVHVTRKRLLDIDDSKALGIRVEDESKRPPYEKSSRPFYFMTIASPSNDACKHAPFMEPGHLRLGVRRQVLKVVVTIEDFWVRLPRGYEDLEEQIRKKIKSATDNLERWRYFAPLIDYWSVDWSYDGVVFKHDFISLKRKRGEDNVKVSATHTYPEPGTYRVVVKVMDVFGGETSRELKLTVGK